MREDTRFRSVGPNVLEMIDDDETLEELGEEDGLWFDYVFVEFLKTNYSEFFCPSFLLSSASITNIFLDTVSVQRSILLDPNATEPRKFSIFLPSHFERIEIKFHLLFSN